jgi:CRP-like cAMP-binding protein
MDAPREGLVTDPTAPQPIPPEPADTLTLVEKTAFLKSVEVLSRIPTEALARLAARSHEVQLEAGEVLFREGDETRGAFLVIDGAMQLRHEQQPVRRMGERAVFGELFVERGEPYPYTAVAEGPATLLNVQTQDVLDSLIEFPEFAVAVVHTLADRNARLTDRLLDLETRLAALEARLREAGLADGAAPPRRRRRFGRRG